MADGGSAWCWVRDDHTSGTTTCLTELYRRHLMNLYELIARSPRRGLTSILESAGGLGPANGGGH